MTWEKFMNQYKSPLQLHYENILSLQILVNRWSMNNHYIIGEHLRNINRALADEKIDDFTHKCNVEYLAELRNKSKDEYALFEELYRDQNYLYSNIPLSTQDKLSFVERVGKRCVELDLGYSYNLILNELNSYLEFLLSQSPDLSEAAIYENFRFKIGYTLLGSSYRTLSKKLTQIELSRIMDKLSNVPLFNSNDFPYLQPAGANMVDV